jgi:hypothetical protein
VGSEGLPTLGHFFLALASMTITAALLFVCYFLV